VDLEAHYGAMRMSLQQGREMLERALAANLSKQKGRHAGKAGSAALEAVMWYAAEEWTLNMTYATKSPAIVDSR